MIDTLSAPDATFAFIGLISLLLIASTALFWSIEEQRANRHVARRKR